MKKKKTCIKMSVSERVVPRSLSHSLTLTRSLCRLLTLLLSLSHSLTLSLSHSLTLSLVYAEVNRRASDMGLCSRPPILNPQGGGGTRASAEARKCATARS